MSFTLRACMSAFLTSLSAIRSKLYKSLYYSGWIVLELNPELRIKGVVTMTGLISNFTLVFKMSDLILFGVCVCVCVRVGFVMCGCV